MSKPEDIPTEEQPMSEGDRWVILKEAADLAGVSVSTLRKWYGTDQIESRLEPGPTGERRVVRVDEVLARAGRALRRAEQVRKEAGGSSILTMETWREMQTAYLEAQQRAEEARVEAARQTFAKEAAEREQLRAAQEAAQLRQRVAKLEEELVEARKRWWRRA